MAVNTNCVNLSNIPNIALDIKSAKCINAFEFSIK